MFLPFSHRAKIWEPIALELRAISKTALHAKLDPWVLAPELGLAVFDDHSVLNSLPPEFKAYLYGSGKQKWSGGVHPEPNADGTLLCILNPLHSSRRNKITLMEEIAHIYLDHVPSGVQYDHDGIKFRDYNEAQEQEAYGVGAAALLPWQTFFKVLNTGKTIDEVSATYDVTTDLVRYRIKVTGASNLYKSRQNSQKSR